MATDEQKEVLMDSIANDMLLMKTSKEITEKYHISESTFYRIRKSKKFDDVLSAKRMMAFEHMINQTYVLAEIGFTEMLEIMKSKKTNKSDKIKIWNIAMNNLTNHQAQISILSRLAEVEEIAKGNTGGYADE